MLTVPGVEYLAKGVEFHPGDSRDVLKTIPDCSIDSVVTDPPYALVSIAKRFSTVSAKDIEVARSNPHRRTSGGFMGKQWDTGETAFSVEFWTECLRVLKPGGHVVAFSGTRTYHRMACAIEDAGFEVRDMLSWLYGSGFPKSHDVSKGIDKKRDDLSDVERVRSWLNAQRLRAGVSFGEINSKLGRATNGGGRASLWMTNPSNIQCPTWDDWIALKQIIGFGDEMDSEIWRLNGRKGRRSDEWLSAEIVSIRESGDPVAWFAQDERGSGIVEEKALSERAIKWQGWGTALKPACEPICFGRKPLIGTVAQNVLQHGTGAINVDGCRVGEGVLRSTGNGKRDRDDGYGMQGGVIGGSELGRWPANVLHDGSEEVVAAFPESETSRIETSSIATGSDGWGNIQTNRGPRGYDGSGSAARFFYTAKANADDRLGSKHPTVKPVDLMQWLCRLVTPKGGTILDPFAGTGTTGEAAFREGFNAVLIESEPEYQADIRRRMALMMAGPDERLRESIKAKNLPRDDGPLFAPRENDPPPRESWDEMWARPFDWDKYNSELP